MAISRVKLVRYETNANPSNFAQLTSVSAGNSLIACIYWETASTNISSITVSGESNMTLIGSKVTRLSTTMQWAYLSNVTSGGNKDVSVNFSASSGGGAGICFEYSGLDTTGAFDAVNSGDSVTTAVISLTTTAANALVLGSLLCDFNQSNYSALSGYTHLVTGTSNWPANGYLAKYPVGCEDLDGGAAGARNVGSTGPGGGSYESIIAVSFKPVGGGASTKPAFYYAQL